MKPIPVTAYLGSDQPPPAVVVGLDSVTGLQSARILSARNIPVIGVAKNPEHFACRTRACQDVVLADTNGEQLIQQLIDLSKKQSAKPVLLNCTDMSVLLASRHRESLTPFYHFVLPKAEAVETLTDKVNFIRYAQLKGLPIPDSYVLESAADAEQAAAELSFPAVLKPALKTALWQRYGKAKAFVVNSSEELLACFRLNREWTPALLVQRWIPGPLSNQYTCNAYFDSRSQPLVTFVTRKLRQWPPVAGVGCFSAECRNDEVLDETVRLFQSIGYAGLGYLEMKQDERTGKHYIVEPNIGRPTGRSASAEAGGVELLLTYYCDALGVSLPENRQQQYTNVKWIYWRHDLQAEWHALRRDRQSWRQIWTSRRGRKAFAIFSWRDPVPFFADFLRTGRKVFRARKARSSSRNMLGSTSTANNVRQDNDHSERPLAKTDGARS